MGVKETQIYLSTIYNKDYLPTLGNKFFYLRLCVYPYLLLFLSMYLPILHPVPVSRAILASLELGTCNFHITLMSVWNSHLLDLLLFLF